MMSNLLLLKTIVNNSGINIPKDILLYISTLSLTPICYISVKIAKMEMISLLQDIINVNKIYSYDFDNFDGELDIEYCYNNSISNHCYKVNPLNRKNYNLDEIVWNHTINGEFSIQSSSEPDWNDMVNIGNSVINWNGVTIINNFRRIIPINYMPHQFDDLSLYNYDDRICSSDFILHATLSPQVIALRPATMNDLHLRVRIIDDTGILYSDSTIDNTFQIMISEDKLSVELFWKGCTNPNSKILWRPLTDLGDSDEVSTIELIH